MTVQQRFGQTYSTVQQIGRDRRRWYSAYMTMLIVGAIFTGLAWSSAPSAFSIALAALVLTAAAWVVKPLVGLHLTILFTLFGDSVTVTWFPFTKDLSSRESLLYVARQINFTPLEAVLVFASVCWLIRHTARHEFPVVTGPLFRPLVIFTAFVIFGFVYGLSRGGDARIAVFEVRGLLYLPIVYFLVSNTCHTAKQYRALLWTAMCGVLGQSLMSLVYYFQQSEAKRKTLEALGEHGASVSMNALFVFAIASMLFAGATRRTRLVLLTMILPVAFTYLVAKRRAAIIGLAVALLGVFVVLFWRRRRTFWRIVPVLTLLLVGYVGAFWNSTGSAGFPAQALKTVIAPGSVSSRDASSDLYRVIENFDLRATIRQSPLTGLGFGQPFQQPITLPDISFFEFYRYIPHNSILWIWIQTGFFGFASLFFVLGRSLAIGARRTRQLFDGRDIAVVLTGTLFVLMYAVFCYVDIAWDARGTVFLALAIAICANFPVPPLDDVVTVGASVAVADPETYSTTSR
jgi:O-antigen ligase